MIAFACDFKKFTGVNTTDPLLAYRVGEENGSPECISNPRTILYLQFNQWFSYKHVWFSIGSYPLRL
jgi:hypothetical protein